MNSTMTYEKLYNNMVKKFTVENNNTDYTLGDYMLMKAQSKKNAMTTVEKSNLPVAAHENKAGALSAVFSYVNDKLTVKKAPVRDKTIRSFPFRTSFTALCSALVVCALVVSCCIFGLSAIGSGKENIVSITHSDAELEESVVIEETLMLSESCENN